MGNVIKFEGSEIQNIQKSIDKLAEKVGEKKYSWKNLKNTVSLAEQLQDIADALKALDGKCESTDCPKHYIKHNGNNISYYNDCSSDNSMVDAKVCSGNYDFSGCGNYDNSGECKSR